MNRLSIIRTIAIGLLLTSLDGHLFHFVAEIYKPGSIVERLGL